MHKSTSGRSRELYTTTTPNDSFTVYKARHIATCRVTNYPPYMSKTTVFLEIGAGARDIYRGSVRAWMGMCVGFHMRWGLGYGFWKVGPRSAAGVLV